MTNRQWLRFKTAFILGFIFLLAVATAPAYSVEAKWYDTGTDVILVQKEGEKPQKCQSQEQFVDDFRVAGALLVEKFDSGDGEPVLFAVMRNLAAFFVVFDKEVGAYCKASPVNKHGLLAILLTKRINKAEYDIESLYIIDE